MPLKLDISSLEDAVARLEESYELARAEDTHTSPAMTRTLRAGAIQAFEFTYEQSFKMIKRFLEMAEFSPKDYNGETFQAVIRAAYVHGLLLNDLSAWLEYRKKRGTTSHAYKEEKAQEVYEAIPGFIREVRYLRDQMKKRIADL